MQKDFSGLLYGKTVKDFNQSIGAVALANKEQCESYARLVQNCHAEIVTHERRIESLKHTPLDIGETKGLFKKIGAYMRAFRDKEKEVVDILDKLDTCDCKLDIYSEEYDGYRKLVSRFERAYLSPQKISWKELKEEYERRLQILIEKERNASGGAEGEINPATQNNYDNESQNQRI